MESKRTEISQLGEFGLINRIASGLNLLQSHTVRGVGDDAAVIDLGDQYGLLSTDMLLEGVHFDLAFHPLKHLGYKAVAVNISDIAAMNGEAQQITVSIALSNRFSVEAVEELYEGIKAACGFYKVDLVGGDTTASRGGLVISVTAFGRVDKDKIVYRNRARENDILCVSGDLGGAYLGLQVLEREKQVFLSQPDMQPELTGSEYVVSRQLKPEARVDIVAELENTGVIPTSMIDVSDGLASELLHLCSQSKTGAVLFEDKIPVNDHTFLAASELKINPLTAAMNGGEDYELLFTISQSDYEKIRDSNYINFIGYLTDVSSGVNLQTRGGGFIPVTAQGWNHFS